MREYLIYLRKDAISQGNAESYYKLWAQNLSENDIIAREINDCRRVWLFFFYCLVEQCRDLESEVMRNRFAHETRTMMIHCLSLERSNALYNLKIPWFHAADQFPLHYCAIDIYPSINKRLVNLLELFQFQTNEILQYFQPIWDISFSY